MNENYKFNKVGSMHVSSAINFCKCRTILWHMVFWGFVINYIFCINLNITIVDMVVIKTEQQQQQHTQQLISEITNTTTEVSSFFWLHWLTQLPGGVLAKKYGTKLVFGLSNVICCWMCFFIPMTANYSVTALIVLRTIQGAIAGLTWPAMHVLIAKWIPPDERSKFVTAYFGSSIGVAFAYPLFAYMMHYMSWKWVYLFCGIFGTLWWLLWLVLVYDSPAHHPRISISEYFVRYIEKALGSSVQQKCKSVPTPWKEIFTSRPVWMNVIGQWASIWGLFTLMIQSPTYFKVIHNWDIRAIGILSGIPHILRMFFAYIFSLYADYLLRTNKMGQTNLRKFATAICKLKSNFFKCGTSFVNKNKYYLKAQL
ncbi:Vesicular glutamate transporter 1 [Lucilia cuprina]|nr:Vesicular glutamate transporter 1 [Lucilia cuprina]